MVDIDSTQFAPSYHFAVFHYNKQLFLCTQSQLRLQHRLAGEYLAGKLDLRNRIRFYHCIKFSRQPNSIRKLDIAFSFLLVGNGLLPWLFWGSRWFAQQLIAMMLVSLRLLLSLLSIVPLLIAVKSYLQ